MDAETLVADRRGEVSARLDLGQPSLCRAGVSQVRYFQFPRLGEGPLRTIDTAESFDQKGGRQTVSSVWDRATALYVRVMNALDQQGGQGLVEYALIIVVVAVMLAGALVTFRISLINSFDNISTQLTTNGGS